MTKGSADYIKLLDVTAAYDAFLMRCWRRRVEDKGWAQLNYFELAGLREIARRGRELCGCCPMKLVGLHDPRMGAFVCGVPTAARKNLRAIIKIWSAFKTIEFGEQGVCYGGSGTGAGAFSRTDKFHRQHIHQVASLLSQLCR